MDQGEFRELQERYNNLKELSSQGMFEYERDEKIPLIMLAYIEADSCICQSVILSVYCPVACTVMYHLWTFDYMPAVKG